MIARPTVVVATLALAAMASGRASSGQGSELILEPARVVEFTTDEGTWMSVDVSPGGEGIVFDLLGDLYTLPTGGGQAERLTEGMGWDTQPRYSPDGTKIAFISDRDGTDNIWVMNADGSEPFQVTKSTEEMYGSPSWSPDGEYLIARRWGAYPREWAMRKIELWMFHIDGGRGIQVTKGEGVTTIAVSPSFSPDGKHVYFASSAQRFQYNADLGRFQVRRLDRDSGEIETLTSLYGGGLSPRVTPDGDSLIYATRYDGQTGLRIRDLRTREERWLAYPIARDNQEGFVIEDLLPGYGITPDGDEVVLSVGGKLRRVGVIEDRAAAIPFQADVRQELAEFVWFPQSIADGDMRVGQLRWTNQAPDGSQVVFSAVGKLWAADLPGDTPRRLTDLDHREYMPSYSPDGRWIVYASWSDSEGGHLWKVPSAGGAPVRLTEAAALYANPRFSPDGTRIAFVVGSSRGWLTRDSSDIREVRWMDADGGPSTRVITAPGIDTAPVFSADGERLYFVESRWDRSQPFFTNDLNSIRLDSVDKRHHATISGSGVEAVPSPDGRWLAFTHQGNVYLAALPRVAGEAVPISAKNAAVPVWQITREGGTDVAWNNGGDTISWSFTNTFSRIGLNEVTARRADEGSAQPGSAQPEAAPSGAGTTDENGPQADDRQSGAERGFQPETFTIELTVPRWQPEGTVALRGARLITMVDDQVIEPGTIVIAGSRVADVGPTNRVEIPRDATVIDVSGQTIIPGFVDAHAHMFDSPHVFTDTVWPYAANLAYGVTSARDPSNANNQVFAYAEMVDAGEVLGPRITSTGAAMTTREATINSYEDALAIASRYKRRGATFLKEYLQPRRIQRQWLAKAAREVGVNITAEGGGELKQDLTLALDGYTGFEHSLPVVPIYRDVIELLARSGTGYTPTLLVSFGGPDGQNYYRQRYDIHADEKLRRFTPHEQIDRRGRRRRLLLDEEYHFSRIAKGAADIFKAGGTVMLGAHGEQQGIGAHWELWAMASGGLTPEEALVVATRMGAEGIGFGADVGTIETGKLADLIVLNRNPLSDLATTVDIRYVVKNGAVYDAATLDQIWPQQVPFPPFFWQNDRPRR